MKKFSTTHLANIFNKAKFACIVLLLVISILPQQAKAGCTGGVNDGALATWSASAGVPTTQTKTPFNQGRDWSCSVTSGISYQFVTGYVSTAYDDRIWGTSAAGFTGTSYFDQDASTGAETVTWTATYSGTLYVGIHHYLCATWNGLSSTLTYKQNTVVTNTSATTRCLNAGAYGLTYSLSAGTLAPTWSVISGPGTVSGSTLTPTAAGTIVVRATVGVSYSDASIVITATPTGTTLANYIDAGTIACGGSGYSNTQNNATTNCFGNTYTGTNNQASDDIFYRFTIGGSNNTVVNIGHCGSGFDTYIHYLNSAGTWVASNDDGGPVCAGTAASLQPTLAPGTYFVVSEGFSTNTGNITTAISITAPSGGSMTTGTASVCEGVTGVVYSVTGSSSPYTTRYVWTVPSGSTITAGQGTSSITVTWGATSGNVSCTPYNGDCAGTTINYAVTVSTLSTAPTTASNTNNTICSGGSSVVSVTGGAAGTGGALVWYSGSACPAFTENWITQPYSTANTTVNSTTAGILNVTSTSGDPMINMYNTLGSFDPSVYRFINVRYKVNSGTAGSCEIFFTNSTYTVPTGAVDYAAGALISDGAWHVLSIDMPGYNGNWLTGGNITGWRFDWATNTGVTMDIDYINLSTSAPLSSTTVTPASTTTYFTRYEGQCNATACATSTTVTVVADPALTAATLTNSSICSGGSTDASSTLSGGTGTQSPVWEYSTDNSTFTTVVNGTPTGAVYTNTGTTTMTIAGISAAGTYYYRRNLPATGLGCNATSASVTLTVVADPALSAATLTNSTICVGGSTDATSNLTGGTGTQTPVWQYSTDNSTFTTVVNGTPAGATYTNTGTATMTISGITASGTYYYRRNLPATGVGCNATSASVTLTVAVDPTWATNSFAPASGNSICVGGTVTFSATVNGAQGGTVTWVRSTTAGGSGTTVTSPDAPPSTGTYYYRPQYTPGANGCNLADGTESSVVVNGLTAAPTLNTATPGSNGQIYVQNFDATLSSTSTVTWTDNSTIPGWYAASTNLGTNGLVIGTGSSATGNLFNFGSSGATDRSIGSLASASTGTLRYGVKLTNSTGSSIDKIYVQYTGEQWRAGGGTAVANALTLDYSVDPAATITSGTYNTTSSLSFTSPITPGAAGALDGNLSANRSTITGIISLGSSLANGSSVWLRWTDLDEASSDHGLGVDDLTVILYSSTSGTNICVGYNGPNATITPGTGGSTGAADTYEKSIDNGLTWSSYSSGATINTAGATGNIMVRGSRSAGSYGCMPAGPNVLAHWPVTTQVSPVLASQSPASGNTICVGYNSGTATITAGSGGTGSADDVQVSIDGGSTWSAYTSGSAISTAGGSGSVKIRMQRTAGTYGCGATGYTTTTLWNFSNSTVNPTLNVATPASGTGICAGYNGPNATITAGSGGSSGAADTYEFSIDNGSTWSAYTSGATIDATGATGSVKVRASRSSGSYGCSATGPVVLATWPINSTTVNPTLNLATPASGTGICAGYNGPNATITAGSGGSSGATDTYEFSIDNGSTWSAYTSGATIDATGATGSVKVRASRSSGSYGCTATGPTVIATWPINAPTVNPTLNVATPASGTGICAGYNGPNATITAGSGGSSGAADTYEKSIDNGSTWSAYTSGATIDATGATGSVQVRVSRSAGSYGCTATGPTVIATWPINAPTVNPILNVATPASGTGICDGYNGPNATITAGSGGNDGAADTYEFSIDNGSTWSSYTSGATIDATGATGSVKVRASRSSGSYGCSATGPVVLATWPINSATVNPTLNTATPSSGTTICQGTSVSATIIAGSGGSSGATDTYEFSIDNGSTWSSYTSGASITTTTAVGSVKVRASRSAGSYGCVATGPTVIASWPVDEMPIPNAGPDQVVCSGYSTTLAGNAAPGGGSGVWTYDAGNPSGTAFITANNPTAAALASAYGTHVYYWTLSYGVCPDQTDDVSISYSAPIVASAVVDDCAFAGPDKDIVLVTATGGTGTLTYTSSNVLDAQLPNIDNNTQPFEAPTDGLPRYYTVTDIGGCNSATSNVITFNDHPTDIPSVTTSSLSCYSKMLNKWLTFRDSNNDALLSIKDNNQNLGMVTVNMYKESSEPEILNSSGHAGTIPTNGNCYLYPEKAMQRHFAITAQNTFASPVDVRLYFSDAELQSLITSSTNPPVDPNDGCADDDDVHNINELYVTKYSGANVDGDYTNNISDLYGGIYRLFGTGVTAPNTDFDMVSSGGFSSLFSSAPSHHYLQMHVTEFSEFWIHGTSHLSPLPVEMIYFEANAVNNTFIQLKWATSLEINNDGFNVERSIDGQTWTQIAFVDGHDNSTVQHDYSYNDINVVAGTRYYYRLKQLDNDGQFKYTDVVTAIINGEITFSVKDFVPNPTNAATSLIVTAVTQQEITVAFYNVIGEKVSSEVHQLIKGGNLIEFDLSRFASGTYTAVVSSANEVYTKKLVLTK